MERGYIQKSRGPYRNIRWLIGTGLVAVFIWPVLVFASGSPLPISIYEPYRIKRNIEYIFLDSSKDYYSYLLGDKLDPLAFYMANRYFQGKPLSKAQISDLEKIFKNNGDYMDTYDDSSPFEDSKVIETWKKERNAVMKDNYTYGQNLNSDNYFDPNNVVAICPDGTFENATKLLRERKKTLSSDALKVWIENYDKIYLNCFDKVERWFNSPSNIVCDDRKLQGLQPIAAVVEEPKEGFWSRLIALFDLGEKEVETQEVVSPANDSYVLPFNSRGLLELQQDEEMQNALYYFYKAHKEGLCSNIARDLFKKIADNPSHPHRGNAILGYMRILSNDSGGNQEIDRDILEKINQYLADESLTEIKDSLQIKKEQILAYLYDETEFIKSQKGLDSPSPDFIHDAAIFLQQYKLFEKNNEGKLADRNELAKHSELVRFLYYWNFEKPDGKWLSDLEKEYAGAGVKNIWLALLLRNQDLTKSKYIDIGLSVSVNSKLYYPVLYYAQKDLLTKDKNKAVGLAKAVLSAGMPDIAYNYFADLIMQNTDTLDGAIKFMPRKSVFFANLDTIEYSYVRIVNKTLESLLDEAGWKDKETGRKYYYRFIDKSAETPSDDDLLSFINFGLPLDSLYSNATLRQKYKAKIFTRAFMLGRKDIYIPLLAELGKSNSLLAQAEAAKSETARDFLISYAILKNLNANEDVYGISLHNSNYNFDNTDDWRIFCNYCPEDRYYWGSENQSETYYFTGNEKTKRFNKFLTEDEIKKNLEEKKILIDSSLVQIFGEPVLAHMKTNSGDSRIPEALSYLIKKMRRWHYRDSDGDWPKKLFETLHYNYPNSKWTKETPIYW